MKDFLKLKKFHNIKWRFESNINTDYLYEGSILSIINCEFYKTYKRFYIYEIENYLPNRGLNYMYLLEDMDNDCEYKFSNVNDAKKRALSIFRKEIIKKLNEQTY